VTQVFIVSFIVNTGKGKRLREVRTEGVLSDFGTYLGPRKPQKQLREHRIELLHVQRFIRISLLRLLGGNSGPETTERGIGGSQLLAV
jgi:hypothetical protein